MSELGTPRTVAAPELLAPAGNWECAVAATENGADAIYFGLDSGFNARARAANFAPERLPELMQFLHHRGVKGYTTLNTLVFTDELPELQKNLRIIADAGVDAVLVQDLGVARIVRQICPDIEVHASTQTLTCAAAIDMAEQLGVSRVVLARECSMKEIKHITSATRMPVEVFVHGALCVAYSGQCLTSESLGGRSANRGQCAQACRLPYDMICDGKDVDLGPVRYLLSPQDLAAYALIPELIEAGVCSLKIEGRLKTPEYVANITSHYRQAIDRAMQGLSVEFTAESQREMELSFSRGFTPGWLEGCNHKRLVPGESSAKKGVLVGEVIAKRGDRLHARLHVPLAKGDGIVLEGDRMANEEVGGRIFDIRPLTPSKPNTHRSTSANAQRDTDTHDDGKMDGVVEVSFARGLIADADIFAGQKIWQTDDPQLNKRLRQSFTSADPLRRVPLDIQAQIQLGKPLRLTVSAPDMQPITVEHDYLPQVAQRHALDLETLTKQFSRLGSTVYELYELSGDIDAQVMVPLSVLGQWRHAMIDAIEQVRLAKHSHPVQENVDVGALIRSVKTTSAETTESKPILRVLCRTLKQLRQALDLGAEHLIADFHDLREYKQAEQLMQWGAQRVTASYDLNRDQLLELVAATPPHWLEVVVHQHMPMFHMEHCVFCTVLSPGTNKTNCGRPCDRHAVKLRDRIGAEHVLHADIGCRNTLYNGTAQSGAEAVAGLLQRGIRSFRIEMLNDTSDEDVKLLITLYRQLLAGELPASEVWRQLKAANRVGVTRGTLEHPRNPLAIL